MRMKMPYTLRFSGKDASREGTGFTVFTNELKDPNTADAELTAFITALNAVTQTFTNKIEATAFLRSGPDNVAGLGNREDKILISYYDTVTLKAYTVTLPCREPYATLPTLPNSDLYNLAIPPWSGPTGFVSAFQTLVYSPDGNEVLISSARLVGRNI